MLNIIAALARDRVIGLNGGMPWHLGADLRHFKTLTMGSVILMGRRTFASIGRPLPGRRNIVLSQSLPAREGVEVFPDLNRALAAVGDAEVWAIGGSRIYAECLPLADALYLTMIDASFAGDAFFPDFSGFTMVSSEPHEEEGLKYAFQIWRPALRRE